MTDFLLVRHAEADYSFPSKLKTKGWGADLAPLTDLGIQHVKERALYLAEWSPEIVLVSPTTRTMSVALILKDYISAPFKVEFNIHEWIPRLDFNWSSVNDVHEMMRDMELNDFEWPESGDRPWEPYSHIRNRVHAAMRKYLDYERVMLICHEHLIRSLLKEQRKIDFLESIEYSFTG